MRSRVALDVLILRGRSTSHSRFMFHALLLALLLHASAGANIGSKIGFSVDTEGAAAEIRRQVEASRAPAAEPELVVPPPADGDAIAPRRSPRLALTAGTPLVGGAAVLACRWLLSARLEARHESAWRALQGAAGAPGKPGLPAAPSGLRARRSLLLRLQQRLEAVVKLKPKYGALELALPAGLWSKDEEELAAAERALEERTAACGVLLDLHERLGQSPPLGFRAWPLADLEARAAELREKMPQLRKVAALSAQIGQPRLDMSIAAWSAEKLEAHAASLAARVAAARARKEKEELLGKVEAALWRKDRSAEPPMGLSTMSTSELREVLAALEAPAAKAPKQGDP